MSQPKILVTEISGKRPGTAKQRPTEKFEISFDHLIISNNSDGYETDWNIVNVPDDYVAWYKENCKTSDNAWYAPMNRSYAIKYAREKGYDFLIQLDDNIRTIEICYTIQEGDGIQRRYRATNRPGMMNDFIRMLVSVLQHSNAAMSGCQLSSIGTPDDAFLVERYCYSFFALNLKSCPDIFQGDFEDDIEFRLKCAEKKLPVLQISCFRYSKIGQKSGKDESGNRAAYTEAGLKRGEHMRILHGDVYSCGYTGKTASVMAAKDGRYFKHKLKPVKVGAMLRDKWELHQQMVDILGKYAQPIEDRYIIKKRGNDEDNEGKS